jgi:hypothetical protein
VDECKPLASGEPAVTDPAAAAALRRGTAVQVEAMKSKLKAPGTERLILKYDDLLSIFAFKFDLRRYSKERPPRFWRQRAWCRRSWPWRCRLV